MKGIKHEMKNMSRCWFLESDVQIVLKYIHLSCFTYSGNQWVSKNLIPSGKDRNIKIEKKLKVNVLLMINNIDI